MNRAVLLIGSFLSSQAFALDYCKISPEDAQSRICSYNPDQRYVVNGIVNFPVNLRFGDAETIKRTDFAFTGVDKDGKPTPSWMAPRCGTNADQKCEKDRFKNNLPIWPLQEGHSSLMVVTTTETGERLYQFDLRASKEEINATSILSFVYPAEARKADDQVVAAKKQAQVAAWQAQQAKAKEAAAVARLKTDVFYGERNWKYQAKGEPEYRFLAPSEISDNGWLTEMQWPGNVEIPSIRARDPATGEYFVPSMTTQGHMQIINGTYEWFRLSLGGKKGVLDVHNLAWSPHRPDPETGTTSPDVVRQVIFKAPQ